jgi:ArpU family phage transcriptional regulator
MSQLAFILPKIDREETKGAVEKELEAYRILVLKEPEERLPKITQTFSFIPPANTNRFHSSTEDAAVTNIDNEMERQSFLLKVQKAVNRLNRREREVIIKRYMDPEEHFDYQVYNDLGMSERQYYRLKARAFYNLAFALRIEVYELIEEVV